MGWEGMLHCSNIMSRSTRRSKLPNYTAWMRLKTWSKLVTTCFFTPTSDATNFQTVSLKSRIALAVFSGFRKNRVPFLPFLIKRIPKNWLNTFFESRPVYFKWDGITKFVKMREKFLNNNDEYIIELKLVFCLNKNVR